MADLEKTVAIIFSGKDDLSKTITSISKGFDQIDSVVSKTADIFADIGEKVLLTQAALVTLASGGLTLSVLAAQDFNSEFLEISTLIDDTGDSVDTFRNQIKAYAADSTKSISDINAAVYAAISAGTDYKDALDLIETAERLAIAGKAGLQESTVLLASVMNAYGSATDEAGRYSDVFFQTVKLGQTTLPELAASLASVTSIAAAAKIPIETITGAVAHLTAQGMPTAEAITAIRGAIQGILKPSSEAAKTAGELSIEFGASALEAKGLEGILLDVYQATEGNVETIGKLFGNVQGLTGVLATVGKDGGDAFLATLDQMRNASGATTTAYEKMSADVKLANQGLINNFKLTLVEIGDKVLGEYGEIVGGVEDIFQGIQQAVAAGEFDALFDLIREEAGDLAKWLSEIGKALPEAMGDVDFDQYASTFRGMVSEIKKVFAALFPEDLTTKEGLADAIQRIVDMGSTINSVTSGIISAFGPVAKALSSLVDKFLESGAAGEDTAKQLGETFGSGMILSFLRETFGPVGYLLAGVIGAFEDTTDAARDLDLDPLGESLYMAEKQAENTEKKLSDLADTTSKTGDAAKDLADKTKEATETKLIDWSDAAADALAGVTGEAGKTKDGVQEIFDEGVTIIGEIIPDEKSIAATKKKIEDEIPPEKLMRIQADLDIAQIKAEAENFQSLVEWKARLDIAQVEAATRNIETMFNGIATVVDSTADVIGTMVGVFADTSAFGSQRRKIEDWIEREYKMREQAAEQQAVLIEQQIKLNELKLDALESGESMIEISADGLEPDLEMILWKIIEKVQIRANAAGNEFLLGL
jgi:TP901 family phage tail tape measure protein